MMIFLFEKSRRFNLYYSIFVAILSAFMLISVVSKFIADPINNFRLDYYTNGLVPVFFISVLALLYNLFEKKVLTQDLGLKT